MRIRGRVSPAPTATVSHRVGTISTSDPPDRSVGPDRSSDDRSDPAAPDRSFNVSVGPDRPVGPDCSFDDWSDRAGAGRSALPGPPRGGGRRADLLRRLVSYCLGSVVAATSGEVCFVVVYGWLGAGNVAASAAGFVGGAVPNYVLNRRWVWSDRRGRRRWEETTLYVAVALSSFAASVGVTNVAEDWAGGLTDDRAWRVFWVAVAYLGVAGVLFVVKFVLYHFVVFTTTGHGGEEGPAGPSGAPPTTS